MSETQASFVWYDLMTSDYKAAEQFYQKVIGWRAADSGLTDRSYTLLSVGDTMVAGIMPIPADAAGAPACWTGYIGVSDVDDYAQRVVAAGGSLRRAPEDIPGIGRFAVVADPHGPMFILFSGSGMPPSEVAPNTPGHIGWHELHGGDLGTDWEFYSGLFGWTKAEVVDMGPMGIYQTFATRAAPIGGMMTKMPETPQPFWLYYFNVKAIDAAIDRAKEGGGQVLMGPHQVPGGSWIVQCLDPQGALFAMVSLDR